MIRALLGASVTPVVAGCRRSLDLDATFVDPSFRRGHRLRDRAPIEGPFEERSARVLVLGGGAAGLSAAWALGRAGVRDVRVLELEMEPGGTAWGEDGTSVGHPWGAHYLPAPGRAQPDLVKLLEDMGLVEAWSPDGQPIYAEGCRLAEPKERVFAEGMWHEGLVPPLDEGSAAAEALARFRAAMLGWARRQGRDGRRAFALPLSASSEDPELRALDELSFAEWLTREGHEAPIVRWLASYATRDDFGILPEQTSAWYGLHYHAARIFDGATESAGFLTWPEGNQRIIRHLVRGIVAFGGAIDGGQLVRRVRPHPSGQGVEVFSETAQSGSRWRAERVIFALPQGQRRYLLEGFPEVDFTPETSPWLVANLHLSRRPYSLGAELAWDNVLFEGRSLGYVHAGHQRGPWAGPTVWTWYLPLLDAEARRALLAMSAPEAAEVVLSDLERAHPDLRRCVERVELRRWGHAMPSPVPGTLGSRAREAARSPVAGVSFAHVDLSGMALFEEAFAHGLRAAEETRRALG